MQPDYNPFWRSLNNDGQTPEAHFYAFFEDSLNQFISTNSDSFQYTANGSAIEQVENTNAEQVTEKPW